MRAIIGVTCLQLRTFGAGDLGPGWSPDAPGLLFGNYSARSTLPRCDCMSELPAPATHNGGPMTYPLLKVAALVLGTVLVTGTASALPLASPTHAPTDLDRFEPTAEPIHFRRYKHTHYRNRYVACQSYRYRYRYPYACRGPYLHSFTIPNSEYGIGPRWGFGLTWLPNY